MFCSNCGRDLGDLKGNCPNCGWVEVPIYQEEAINNESTGNNADGKTSTYSNYNYNTVSTSKPTYGDAYASSMVPGDIERFNRDEKKWLLLSSIAGIVLALCVVFRFFPSSSNTNLSFGEILIGSLFTGVLTAYAISSMIYGIHRFHPLRRPLGALTSIIIIGWLATIFIAIIVGGYGGMFYWYPVALFKVIIRKPILTDKQIANQYEKGLLR